MTGQTNTSGIVTRKMCKSFGSHLLLEEVNLTADEGSILALPGPNGAGKTTIVRILHPDPADSGSTRIARPRRRWSIRMGSGCDRRDRPVLRGGHLLTGAENLRLIGRPAPPRPRREAPMRERAAPTDRLELQVPSAGAAPAAPATR